MDKCRRNASHSQEAYLLIAIQKESKANLNPKIRRRPMRREVKLSICPFQGRCGSDWRRSGWRKNLRRLRHGWSWCAIVKVGIQAKQSKSRTSWPLYFLTTGKSKGHTLESGPKHIFLEGEHQNHEEDIKPINFFWSRRKWQSSKFRMSCVLL